jgi:hypothetical protein
MQPLTIVRKQSGTPSEIAIVSRRLGTPQVIQPVYDFDITSLMIDPSFGVFKTINGPSYVVRGEDHFGILCADSSVRVIFPNTLKTGFQVTVINNTVSGWVRLDASTLHAKQSCVTLKNQYAGASAAHKGVGEWFAFGYLT